MQILPWLPGYFWDGHNLRATGAALPPTQHVDHRNGEIRYYCRPIFPSGCKIGLFIRKQGILDWISKQ